MPQAARPAERPLRRVNQGAQGRVDGLLGQMAGRAGGIDVRRESVRVGRKTRN